MIAQAARIRPQGDAALVVELEERIDLEVVGEIQGWATRIREMTAALPRIEVVAAYASILISYDPAVSTYGDVEALVNRALAAGNIRRPARTFTIPVLYGGEYGPDLEEVTRLLDLPAQEIIARHTGRAYPIHCLGFAPGFPYLGGLDPALSLPRLPTPRVRVPAGSVAIGGSQTGVYPTATPGGWRIIGRTSLLLFDPRQTPPIAYRPGDILRFHAVSDAEYRRLAGKRVMPEGK